MYRNEILAPGVAFVETLSMLDKKLPPSGAERWKAAAFELSRDHGLPALSTRALAQKAGGSPSTVAYYLGNRALVVSEVCTQALAAAAAHREGWRQNSDLALSPWLDPAGAIGAALQARLETGRHVFALLREIEQEALVSDWPEISAAIAADTQSEREFWSGLAMLFGATEAQGQQWADVAIALIIMCLSLASAAQRSIWIAMAVHRLQQRFARQTVQLMPDLSEQQELASRPARSTPAASRILDAALVVIAEKGADRFNQRELASRAGVSLSAITYFFGTKQQLVATTFDDACRREYAVIADSDTRELNRADLILGLSTAANVAPLAAIQVLFRAALRHGELGEAANRMRALRGSGSLLRLRRLGLQVDRLDGYLWMAMVSGRYQQVFNLPAADQYDVLRSSAQPRLEAMFD